MRASEETFPLLAELLAEQQRLDTPVARFANAHGAALFESPAALAPQLIPLSKPGPGEQYAFEVDLDRCTGCKSCVAACHSLNGLEDTETWRDVGQLVSPRRAQPFSQTVTTACHHCADPACLNGCPVLAYDKDPITGIVRHLDDQCIGCSYCILKCPYDVPKFSSRLGIVRKCDMCHGRLAAGEAPACAQACPTQAIRIVTVSVATPHAAAAKTNSPGPLETTPLLSRSASAPREDAATFLPGAPDPAYTRPTTRYVSKRGLPVDVVAADVATLRVQPAHWPLAVLLVLMPTAIGCGIADTLVRPASPILAVLGWAVGFAGLLCSILHLGQPLRAWRIFLGLRRSWLSREALVFGLWFPLVSLRLAARLGFVDLNATLLVALKWLTPAAGLVGLACSVMIYVDTRRTFWRLSSTAPRFFGTAAVLGSAAALAVVSGTPALTTVAGVVLLAVAAKLLAEAAPLRALYEEQEFPSAACRTAQLVRGPLRSVQEARVALALAGGIALPLFALAGLESAVASWAGFLLLLTGELLERSLFFRAVDAPKMPGVASA